MSLNESVIKIIGLLLVDPQVPCPYHVLRWVTPRAPLLFSLYPGLTSNKHSRGHFSRRQNLLRGKPHIWNSLFYAKRQVPCLALYQIILETWTWIIESWSNVDCWLKVVFELNKVQDNCLERPLYIIHLFPSLDPLQIMSI